MKKIAGTVLLCMAGLMVTYMVLSWVFWSLGMALRLFEPVLLVGCAIILALIGFNLRDDK